VERSTARNLAEIPHLGKPAISGKNQSRASRSRPWLPTGFATSALNARALRHSSPLRARLGRR